MLDHEPLTVHCDAAVRSCEASRLAVSSSIVHAACTVKQGGPPTSASSTVFGLGRTNGQVVWKQEQPGASFGGTTALCQDLYVTATDNGASHSGWTAYLSTGSVVNLPSPLRGGYYMPYSLSASGTAVCDNSTGVLLLSKPSGMQALALGSMTWKWDKSDSMTSTAVGSRAPQSACTLYGGRVLVGHFSGSGEWNDYMSERVGFAAIDATTGAFRSMIRQVSTNNPYYDMRMSSSSMDTTPGSVACSEELGLVALYGEPYATTFANLNGGVGPAGAIAVYMVSSTGASTPVWTKSLDVVTGAASSDTLPKCSAQYLPPTFKSGKLYVPCHAPEPSQTPHHPTCKRAICIFDANNGELLAVVNMMRGPVLSSGSNITSSSGVFVDYVHTPQVTASGLIITNTASGKVLAFKDPTAAGASSSTSGSSSTANATTTGTHHLALHSASECVYMDCVLLFYS